MIFLSKSIDVTWVMGNVFIWFSVEPCIRIVCACLPTIQPLVRTAFRHIIGSSAADRNFGPSSPRRVGFEYDQRLKSGLLNSSHRRPFQSLDRTESQDRLKPRLRPDDDGIMLTATSAHADVGGSRKEEMTDEGNRCIPLSIQVPKDFQWELENQ